MRAFGIAIIDLGRAVPVEVDLPMHPLEMKDQLFAPGFNERTRLSDLVA